MANLTGMLKVFGLGAGLMYWADPVMGRRRRLRARDRLVHLFRKAKEAVQAVACDAGHRIRGTAAEIRSRFVGGSPNDAVLEQRIRAALGRIIRRPHDVKVAAEAGHVTLLGKVTAAEADDLVRQVSSMRAVREVESLLEVPAKDAPVPTANAAAATTDGGGRVLLGTAGAGAALLGLKRGGLSGAALAALGLGGLAVAASRVSARRLLGADPANGTIDVHKTIHVHAPPQVVFDVWSHWENFPLFMSRVKDVALVGPGRTRWTVAGPLGADLHWNALVSHFAGNDNIAWESEPGSAVASRGAVTFRPDNSGGTQVDVRMTYHPPAGLLGHALAAICGCDPKSQMDEDLNRMKTYIETGHPPADAARKAGRGADWSADAGGRRIPVTR